MTTGFNYLTKFSQKAPFENSRYNITENYFNSQIRARKLMCQSCLFCAQLLTWKFPF